MCYRLFESGKLHNIILHRFPVQGKTNPPMFTPQSSICIDVYLYNTICRWIHVANLIGFKRQKTKKFNRVIIIIQ